MTTKMVQTKPLRPPRRFPDDIDAILNGYGQRARVVVLWRQVDARPDLWTYLGRLSPAEAQIDLIGQRFGHGCYRAKIMGSWTRETRREEYFEQVTLRLDERGWAMTAETRQRIREQHGI